MRGCIGAASVVPTSRRTGFIRFQTVGQTQVAVAGAIWPRGAVRSWLSSATSDEASKGRWVANGFAVCLDMGEERDGLVWSVGLQTE